ncbi:PAS domain-containing sensor histidine kinase [Mucilaginibacter lacusdianchii]|uniref:PAS domain-containing sensor histidine kinase n=1 Tax=Mucilaginibacter lacusdianchii TaxID=2684211 RepID=UPI00131C176D|nr:ATP-binding protein [Mucilaginibacter sp. JXJ CY 39]
METSLQDLATENRLLKEQLESLKASHEQALQKLNESLVIEEHLQESQQRFKTIFEQSRVGHKIINTDLKMIQINQALADMLGYTKEEVTNSVILDYTHPDFVAYWYDLHEALWTRELPYFELEACLIRKDGKHIWCIVHTIRFTDRGQTLGYTILEDITERKQLERHKDEFVSTVSHELKTPLTSLKSQCQVLNRHVQKAADDFAAKMTAGMDKQINRLTRLIKDLVTVSRIESGKLQPMVVPYQLNELVTEVVNEFKVIQPDRRMNIDAPKILNMKGDKDKIHQVIYNLIANAVKFSAKETGIDITVQEKDRHAVVCIQDYGKGVPKDSLERIFDRFYKAETASSHVESGMGLGLYICTEIIKYQNGKLWVDSEPGKGSTFCFTLPMLTNALMVS